MATKIKACAKCDGEGLVTVQTRSFTGKRLVSYQTFCQDCHGTGRIPVAQDAEPLDKGKSENGSTRR